MCNRVIHRNRTLTPIALWRRGLRPAIHSPIVQPRDAPDNPSPHNRGRPDYYPSRGDRHKRWRNRNATSRSPSPSSYRPSREQPSKHSKDRQPAIRSPLRSRSPKHTAGRAKGKTGRSACPKCLGRFPHDVRNCNRGELWDGTPCHCQRNPDGFLINPNGQAVCTDWQRPFGCRTKHSATLHECSGCGDSGHGAQSCPKAQKP